jgi:hypothetical protein
MHTHSSENACHAPNLEIHDQLGVVISCSLGEYAANSGDALWQRRVHGRIPNGSEIPSSHGAVILIPGKPIERPIQGAVLRNIFQLSK